MPRVLPDKRALVRSRLSTLPEKVLYCQRREMWPIDSASPCAYLQTALLSAVKDAVLRQSGGIAPGAELLAEVVRAVALAAAPTGDPMSVLLSTNMKPPSPFALQPDITYAFSYISNPRECAALPMLPQSVPSYSCRPPCVGGQFLRQRRAGRFYTKRFLLNCAVNYIG
jgi:hypothetical protein